MSTCSCDINPKDCECCPVGFVAIYDDCGKFAGCVSPQEAEDYNNGKIQCGDGFVKVINPVTGDFVGCVLTADAAALIASLTPAMYLEVNTSNVKCNGESTGTAGVRVIGGVAPYAIVWSGGADPAALAAGSYTVTVTDNGGLTAAHTISIVEPTALVLNPTTTPAATSSTLDGTATAVTTGGTSPYTYDWRDNTGASIGQTTRTAVGLLAGTYQVFVTDFNGCIISDVNIIVLANA